MKNSKAYISISFWVTIILIIFFLHQYFYQYHFYYLEQFQLFLFDPSFITQTTCAIAGGADVVSKFLQQFYIVPYMGATIVSILLAIIGILMRQIIKKISGRKYLIALPLLTMSSVAFLHFDHNYFLSGTIALIAILGTFLGYLYLKSRVLKLSYSLGTVVVAYFVVGSTALLLAIIITVYEVIKKPKESYLTLIPLVICIVICVSSMYLGWIGDWDRVWTPAMYYSLQLPAPNVMWFSWIAILISVLAVSLLSRFNKDVSLKVRLISVCSQLIVVVVIVVLMIPNYGELDSMQYKRLSYYSRTQQWDKIIEESEASINNYLYNYYLNIALAERGHLADDFFKFDQKGLLGIVVQWDRSIVSSLVMSDMHFALRNPAEAQRISFEANIIIAPKGSAHLYKKLIQTNLVFGNYKVAEKYINLLEKTLFYQEWAKNQRYYLYNEEAINQNSLLGTMRKSIPADDSLFGTAKLNSVLEILAETNPSYTVPIELLGVIHLAARDIRGFQDILDKYYGTEVLPKLPLSFQEAIFVMSEHDPQIWEAYDIPIDLARDFLEYRQFIKQNKDKPNVYQLVKDKYGHTYWFYYMYKN